jgi:hypothetical protein
VLARGGIPGQRDMMRSSVDIAVVSLQDAAVEEA